MCSDLGPSGHKHAAVSMCWGFVAVLVLVFQSINWTGWGVHLDFGSQKDCVDSQLPSIIFQLSLWSCPLSVLALPLICLMTSNKVLYSGGLKFCMFSVQLYSIGQNTISLIASTEKVSPTLCKFVVKKTNHTFLLSSYIIMNRLEYIKKGRKVCF